MPSGNTVSYLLSVDSQKFLSELRKARDEAKKAAKEIAAGTSDSTRAEVVNTSAVADNTSAVAENTREKQANGQAASGNAMATGAATQALNANTAAASQNAAEQRRLAEKMGVVKVSQNELDAAWKKIRVSEDAQKIALGEMGAGMRGVSDLSNGLLNTQQAMSKLMSGNLVGAFKAATSAAISFGKAIALNPILAAITAVTAALIVMAKKWEDARRRKEEYARNADALADTGRSVEWAREGWTISNVSESELEAERKRRRDKANDAQLEYDIAQEAFEATPSDENKEAAQKAADAAIAAWKELDSVEEEQERRHNDRVERRKEAERKAFEDEEKRADKRRQIAARSQDLEDTKRYDEIERTSGKAASLEAQRSDLQAKLDDPFAFLGEPEKRQDAAEKVYQLEQQIRAENEKQVEAQEEWLRKRKLASMTEEEQLKTIKAEIAELRKLPRTAENEAKMRALVDERDAAQKEIDKQAAAASEAAAKEQAKVAEEQAKKAAELEANKDKFLHRNDTDSMRLRQNREELKKAKESGDEARMLELMEEGEQLASNYQRPMSKWDMKKAARQAKREERAAMREARAYRRQVAQVERDFAAGKLTAEEAEAKKPKTEQEKMVNEQKAGNKLLEKIAEALA